MVGDRRRERYRGRAVSRSLAIPESLRQRQTRASNPKTSAWVSANAGSGKTHVLTQRVLRLAARRDAAGADPLPRLHQGGGRQHGRPRVQQARAMDEPQRRRPGESDRRERRGRAGSARAHLRAAIVRAHHREPWRPQDSDAARLRRAAAAALSFRGECPGPFQRSRRKRIRSGCLLEARDAALVELGASSESADALDLVARESGADHIRRASDGGAQPRRDLRRSRRRAELRRRASRSPRSCART